MLKGALSKCGYDWWWHSFTGHHNVTGEEKAFFIEFFTCNPSIGGDEPILGQLEENKREHKKPSYLMVKVGTWGEDAVQLHRFFGWNSVSISTSVPFSVEAGDCFLSEKENRENVIINNSENHPEWMYDNGSMSWNLSIEKQIAYNVGYGASKPLRESGAFEMFWHAEGMKTSYSGEVIFNGERYIISPDTCYGYADKNWGKDFTSPWVWLSSNNLTINITGKKLTNSVFNIGGVGNLELERKLLAAFYYEGESCEFNFSNFWTLTQTEIIWHVEQKTPLHRMVTDITCEKKDMLLINYESPDGEKRHNRLWNGGNGKGTVELYEFRVGRDKLIDKVQAQNVAVNMESIAD